MRVRFVVALIALVTAAATPRPAERSLGEYRIAASNTMGHVVDFSYVDIGSTTEHQLGSVDGGGRKVFSLEAVRDSVVVVERADAMPGWENRVELKLRADSTVEVQS